MCVKRAAANNSIDILHIVADTHVNTAHFELSTGGVTLLWTWDDVPGHVPPTNSPTVCVRSKSKLCFHPEATAYTSFYQKFCSQPTTVVCTPEPDDFNPCEDIMTSEPLRVVIWMVAVLALLGNGTVLLVLMSTNDLLTQATN